MLNSDAVGAEDVRSRSWRAVEQGTHSWKAFTELGMPPTSFPLLRVLSVETPRSCLGEGALIPNTVTCC